MLRESEVFVYYFDVRVLLCCRWEFFVVVLLGMNVFLNAELLNLFQSRAESTRDTYNYGQDLNQFPPNTIKVIREFERIQKKICRHKMSIMFNEICINIYIYIYIYRGRKNKTQDRPNGTLNHTLISTAIHVFSITIRKNIEYVRIIKGP